MTHLQTPIAHMDIANHAMALGAQNTFDRFAQDGRAQMSDMHRLGDIGAAVIDNNRLWRLDL